MLGQTADIHPTTNPMTTKPKKTGTPRAQLIEIAYNSGFLKGIKACGGCTLCYGKGYSTVLNDPHLGRGEKVLPCKCPRGKAIRELVATGSINLG